jgi:ABC-type Fe3+/spermidine/putrescine transport system ATPase subunit
VSSSSPLLRVERLSADWDDTPVLREVSFTLDAGEFLVLLGPNGSGKTTLLRCLAGLERPRSGRIYLSGEEITRRPTHERGIGLMFQQPSLFPHRSVYENIAYAPLLQRRARSEVESEVDSLVELLRLGPLVDRRPEQLSGGEMQRVALARTLAARPRLVLLDEPFASIDVEVKGELHAEFRRALRERGTAAIHVTHDREEGLFLGDRVGLLFDGRLEAPEKPETVYRDPRSRQGARFLGYNVLPGPGGYVAVHPTDLHWSATPGPGLSATVLSCGVTGRDALVLLVTDEGGRVELRVPDTYVSPHVGARVTLSWDRSIPLPL